MKDSFGLLVGDDPAPVSLKSLHWKGALDGLLFTYTVTQLYKNTTQTPLDISYSFPLSWNSVLTDFAAEINGEELHAERMRKKDAEAKYEKTLEKGDLPLMLKCSDSANGVCTANLGCLKPGEEAKLMLTFAQVLRFELGRVRISIPTVVGDRYSADGRQGALLPHQNVMQNILANYPASAEIEIRGPVSESSVTCTNHIATFKKKDGVLTIRIAQATLNRDITFLCEGVAPFAEAKFAKKPNGIVASLITSVYRPETATSKKALRLKILVDCSGSMGNSFYQTKAALFDLMDELGEEDEITFSRFGSDCVHEIQSFTAVTKTALLRDILPVIDWAEADMYSTEFGRALSSVFALGGAEKADVLLITDGEIWDAEWVVETAKKSGHRVFAIVVSTSPSQHFLKDLALKTGGAVSVVMPGEDMAEAVRSMVQLMRSEQGPKLPLFGEEEKASQPLFVGTGFAVPSAGMVRPALDSFVPEQLKSSVLMPECWKELPEEKVAVLEKIYAHSVKRSLEGPKADDAVQKYGVLSLDVDLILVKERTESDQCFEMTQPERVPEMERLYSCSSPMEGVYHRMPDWDDVDEPASPSEFEIMRNRMSDEEIMRRLNKRLPRGFNRDAEHQFLGRSFYRLLRDYIATGIFEYEPEITCVLIDILSEAVKNKRGLNLSREALFDLLLLLAYGSCSEGKTWGLLSEDELKLIAGRHSDSVDLLQLAEELRTQDARFSERLFLLRMKAFIRLEDYVPYEVLRDLI